MRLDVRVFDFEQAAATIDCDVLHRVDVLAPAIITMARVAFRVFGGEDARGRLSYRDGRIVLAANELDTLVLSFFF
jgi:hypothetical protein